MTPSDAPRSGPTHRLGELLGFTVVGPSGRRLGHVNDVRLETSSRLTNLFPELVVTGFVVDGRHAGSLLGYDRRAEKGPLLVRWAVRSLHRGAGYLSWAAVARIDWEAHVVTARADALDELDAP